MSRRWPFLLVTLLFPAAARAQPPADEARRAFEEGVALEKKGDYAGALGRFRDSAAIRPTLGNRFHTAYCLEMTGRLAAALEEYEAIDKAAREQKKSEVVEATRARLEPLRGRVPQLTLRMAREAPKDAVVLLDDSALAPPLRDGHAFRVDPGEHTVAARAANHRPFTRPVTLAEGASVTVDITLEAEATPVQVPPTEPVRRAEPPQSSSATLPILTTTGAVVLAGAGIASFLVAASVQSDAEETCPTKVSCQSEQSKVRSFDALALVGFLGAGALGALSVVLWTSRPKSSAAQAALRMTGSWVGLRGQF